MVDKAWNKESEIKIYIVKDFPDSSQYELIKTLLKSNNLPQSIIESNGKPFLILSNFKNFLIKPT